MAALTGEQQAFIVDELAMYGTPTEVALAFKDQFGVVIGRDQVAKYDPRGASAYKLAEKWKVRHAQTRDEFDRETRGSRIASRAWRIKRLEELERKAASRGNIAESRALLEQAAKEVGDTYTNVQKIKHSGSVKTQTPVVIGEEARQAIADKLIEALEKRT